VLNRYCQAHEVKNLFVADAASLLWQSDKNVTLTIVAMAWRTSEYLAEEMRKAMSDSNCFERDLLKTLGSSMILTTAGVGVLPADPGTARSFGGDGDKNRLTAA